MNASSPHPLALVLATVALGACARAPLRQDAWSSSVAGREVRIAVRYRPQDAAVAAQVQRVLRVAVPLAERWGPLTPIAITIHPTHEALEEAAGRPGHPWLRAWARPGGVELQSTRTWSRGDASDAELAQLLAHELTHCVTFQAVADPGLGRTIPVWFREGMAIVTSGESFAAVRTGAPAPGPLAVTAAAYRDDSLRVYATADAAFRALLRAHGEERVRAILATMREGAAFDDAFWWATGTFLSAFEAGWDASARSAGSHG